MDHFEISIFIFIPEIRLTHASKYPQGLNYFPDSEKQLAVN